MSSRSAARDFLIANARVVERRRLLGDADGVRHAVLAHRNDDGGFGHALEPDVRSPHSQPLACETALGILLAAGVRDAAVADGVCRFLAGATAPGGGVPILLPTIAGHPRAAHWEQEEYEPHVNPTASLAGLLHAHGAGHPWLDDATAWCFDVLEREGAPGEAHAVRCAFLFLEHVPDSDRAARLAPAMAEGLGAAAWYRADPDDPAYGVTPLHVADRPDGPWTGLFDRSVLDAHLDRLDRDQQADGGWPITWDAPGPVSTMEWRGVETLRAIEVLAAYGRLAPEDGRPED